MLLALHGAAVADEYPDADAEIIRRVRAVVGPDTPIVATLDLHANISHHMVANTTALVTYRTNPHVDAASRAEEAAQIAFDAAHRHTTPVQSLVRVPAALDILRQNTDAEPMSSVISDLMRIISRPAVLPASVAEGYPYADVPEMGVSALVVTDGDKHLASLYAEELAASTWALRENFTGAATAVRAALERVRSVERGPVLLLDVGDNIGGGAPGDSVAVLREAIDMNVSDLFMILSAPEALRHCERAGIGAAVEVSLGRSDDDSDTAVQVSGTIVSMHAGRFEDQSATHGGQTYFDAGPTAVLRTTGGMTFAITGPPIVPASLVQMTSLGLDPSDFKAIVAKGVNSPLAGYGPVASETILLDTPGCTAADLSRLNYLHRTRPMHPFEDVPVAQAPKSPAIDEGPN